MKKKSRSSRSKSARASRKRATASAEALRKQSARLVATSEKLAEVTEQLHRGAESAHTAADVVHKRSTQTKIAARAAHRPEKFPIVGIGASAGGLEAMTQLLQNLPPDTGMAFVLVQHLDPTHESQLTSLLQRHTKMKVVEARNNMALQPDTLFIIPPNKAMTLAGRKLKVSPRRSDHTPIDLFFRGLAAEEGSRAVGIVLSGNGSDGTQGLLAIKAEGGITFAQDEKSAKCSAMPGSAITAGCVDFVLPPAKMVTELRRIAGKLPALEQIDVADQSQPAHEKAFDEILLLLRQRMGVDFTYYKHATLRRRIQRRMVLHKFDRLKDYTAFLRGHSGEVKELFNDILIHVTGFFRDPSVFVTLRKKVFPRLLKGKGPEDAVRIWIPGCSTGEEVYSLAIALTELMNEKRAHHPVQIFGTDINESALEKARAGIYPENAVSEISVDRLRRFFVKTEGGYRVNKSIRELCIFARQNVVNDPPFSNLDLVSCRNVLIYLGPTLQRKVMPVFHYALRPNGLLMLGVSETIGSFADLFSLVDKKSKIYAKKSTPIRPSVAFGGALPTPTHLEKEKPIAAAHPLSPSIADVQKQADRIVLTSYSLAGVVVNKHLEVIQFRGRTGPFLEHAHGEATLNLLKMAREGLMPELRTAVAKALKQNVRVRQEGLRVRQNGHFTQCNVEVIPFTVPPGQERFYLVLFEPVQTVVEEHSKRKSSHRDAHHRATESAELAHLREELGATRESLQTIIEEQEATNEELRSANEEIMSSNEELQSTNEELETAKEELQSTNEELTTLNDELESRNNELEQVNNDLHNLLASVNIPVLILGPDLKIRRFTSMAEKMFKLIPADIGRPLTDINLPLDIPHLDKLVVEVFESLTSKDLEVQDKNGHWWGVRIRPYKTTDHKIDGAVIALLDIDIIKTSPGHEVLGRDFARAVVNTTHEPMLALDGSLKVIVANEPFQRAFELDAEQTLNRRLYELGGGKWNSSDLRLLLEDTLSDSGSVADFPLVIRSNGIRRKILVNARRLLFEPDGQLTLLAFSEAPENA